jgi:hypothetical protein
MQLAEHMKRCLDAAGLPIVAGFDTGIALLEHSLDKAKGGYPADLICIIRRMSGDWLRLANDRARMVIETRALIELFYDEIYGVSPVMAYAFLLALSRYIPREIIPDDKGGGNLPN